MRIVEILSDLKSLSACENPAAALALVSARPSPASNATSTPAAPSTNATTDRDEDPDLRRAKDLMELHDSVKVAHARGLLDKELVEARERVRRAVAELP